MLKFGKGVALCATLLLATGENVAGAAAPGSKIIFDAEFVKARSQHGEQWASEDKALQQQLAAMRKKYGKAPNIIHIMWDDHSLGQVGIPEMNKVLGFDTPHINQMADEGIAFTRMYTEP